MTSHGAATPSVDTTSCQSASEVRSPWARPADEVARALDVQPDVGLDVSAAEQRRVRWGANELPTAAPPSWFTRFLRQFRDPLVVLLLAAIAVSIIVWIAESADGIPVDAIVIALVVIANASIGTWQEGRAIDAVAALRRLTRPNSTVIREGRRLEIATSDVVVGDALVVDEGDAVTADARLVDAVGLEVDESALTGESVPVAKSTNAVDLDASLADRTSMLYSGTSITRGHGTAIVVATGTHTEVGGIAGLVGDVPEEPTPLQRQIAALSRQLAVVVVAIAVILVGAVVAFRGVDSNGDLLDVLFAAIALAVAAVPEGLPAIMAVVLALGVQRMARQEAIVKRLISVETLGATTIICTDKTGTLTRNEMTVVAAATPDGEVALTGIGYDPDGEIDAPVGTSAPMLDDVRQLLAAGAASSNATLTPLDDGWEPQGDPTELALVVAAHKVRSDERPSFGARVAELPFDGDRKMMSVLVAPADGERGDAAVQITKGAPEIVLDRCVRARVGQVDVPLTGDVREAVDLTVQRWAGQGLRTLAVAIRLRSDGAGALATDDEAELTLLGTVAIIDPLRRAAVRSVAAARDAGLQVRMITGDHPITAEAIARQLGIDSDRVATGAELDGADGDELADRLASSAVLARVTPQHKISVVQELRRRGEVVAMTGDGINDAPALRQADIGIAMGRSGTDVARDASDMILTDDDFGTIVDAVREGRQIYDNIRKFLRYLLATNAGEVLLMIVGVLAAVPLGLAAAGDGAALPLLATQILWINLVTDAAPALALGVDPPVDDVMSRPPRPSDEPVIDPPMWSTILVIGVVTAAAGLLALDAGLAGGLLGGSGDLTQGRTMAFTTVVFVQVFNAFNARSVTTSAFVTPFANRLLIASVALAVIGQIAVVQVGFLNGAFSTVPLTGREWSVCIGLSSLVLVASEAQKWIRRRSLARRDERPYGPASTTETMKVAISHEGEIPR